MERKDAIIIIVLCHGMLCFYNIFIFTMNSEHMLFVLFLEQAYVTRNCLSCIWNLLFFSRCREFMYNSWKWLPLGVLPLLVGTFN